MSAKPQVSILLPVYNAEPYLPEALASLLSQTLTAFEIVAINDGSTDRSGDILREAARNDRRLRLVERENRGLVATLNETIAMAHANYLARMDADDLCVPERLATQAAFLDAHPAVAVVGSATRVIAEDASLHGKVIRYPRDPAAAMLFRSVVAHPSVMMRRESLDRHGLRYREPYRCAQDYDLWCRCVAAGLRVVNGEDPLLHYRVHAGQITSARAEETQVEGEAIRSQFLRDLGLTPADEELKLHNRIARDQFLPTASFLHDAIDWLARLADQLRKSPCFELETLMRVLTGRYVALVRFAKRAGIPVTGGAQHPFEPFILPGAFD